MNKISTLVLIILSVTTVTANAMSMNKHVVNAKLWDEGGKMGITTDVDKIAAGKVTFDVKNISKDMVHEMLVIKVKSFSEKLPYNEKKAKVYEDKVFDFGEVSELEPGQTGSLTVNLKPGKYLLLCNMPGHYKLNMFTKLVVTQ
jgi:uncharacterized cupredoxin-like copper-binding protein